MKKVVFSFDLGSDTLKMGYAYEEGKGAVADVLPLTDASSALPAVALYEEATDTWYYGVEAVSKAVDSQRPIVKIKDLLQKAENETFLNGFDFENTTVGYTFKSKTLSVKNVLQAFFKLAIVDLKDKAVSKLQIEDAEFTNKIMFTFPNTASDASKNIVKELIESLNYKIRALAEPVAAASCCLHEGIKLGNEVMVVDLGVLTSSVAIFKPNASTDDVLNLKKVSNINYGGHHFDEVLYQYVVEQSGKKEEITNYQKYLLRDNIRKAKEDLCNGEEEVVIEYQSDSLVYVNVTRDTFIQETKSIMVDIAKRIVAIIEENSSIDQIILTGGTSNNKFLVQTIQKAIDAKAPNVKIDLLKNGLFAVAIGAAVSATGTQNFKSIVTKSYGFACYNGFGKYGMQIVVKKNDRLPIAVTKKVAVRKNNQSSVVIDVLSTDREAKSNGFLTPLTENEISLKKGVMDFGMGVPRGTAIEVTVYIDQNGIGGVKVVGPYGEGTFKTGFSIK